ncbi:Thiol:disulfide interchange protein DsbD [bacterium HR15]|nr:Thiol:disulfide interchange protein DsbD [bacterium HR15]
MRLYGTGLIVGLFLWTSATAQLPDLKFPARFVMDRKAYTPGSHGKGLLLLEIPAPYHVNANPASEDYLIPTELRFEKSNTFSELKVEYPAAIEKAFEFSGGKPLKIYEGRVLVKFQLKLAPTVKPGTLNLPVTLRYQACDDKACYPPQRLKLTLSLTIASKNGALNPEYERLLKEGETNTGRKLKEYSSAAGGFAGFVEEQFRQGRWFLFVGVLYVGGLALNLTPCVLPLIPITLGFFSLQARGQRGRRVALSALYALSMAAIYALLGTIAALTGKAFGFQFQNPLVTGVLVVLLVLFALSLFGVYKFQPPPALMQYIGARQGWLGAIMMGCLAGVAAAPCIGPVIAALIPIVAALANPTVGFLLFLALGLGLGTPYFVLGLFYEKLQNRMPRSGEWTILVERLFGVLLLSAALFFARSLMSPKLYAMAWLLFFALVAIYFFAFERREITQPRVVRFKQALGVLFLLFALNNGYSLLRPKVHIRWEPYSETRLEQAVRERKPVIIDFTASWCQACTELEEYTYTHPRVVRESERFVRLVVDATREDDPNVQRILKKHAVVGLPTVIFIGSDGQERRDLRLTGFEPPDAFLKRLQQVH